MALAKAVQNARHSGQTITWLKDNGAPVDLTGATITARIRSNASGTVEDSDGIFSLASATDGQFSWAYGLYDVAVAGDYEVQFKAAYGDGKYDLSYLQEWTVEPKI